METQSFSSFTGASTEGAGVPGGVLQVLGFNVLHNVSLLPVNHATRQALPVMVLEDHFVQDCDVQRTF